MAATILIILLVLSVFLQGTITTLPLVLITLLCLTILRRDWSVFPLAFFSGLFLDALLVHRMGEASMFLLAFVFIILLYQRKYEINSYQFTFVASFLGSAIFLLVYGSSNVFLQAVISSFIALLLFGVVRVSNNKLKLKS